MDHGEVPNDDSLAIWLVSDAVNGAVGVCIPIGVNRAGGCWVLALSGKVDRKGILVLIAAANR
jgi:hypothetical protein